MTITREPLAVPQPGPFRRLRPPKVAEDKLKTGLRVLVVRKPTVPRVEARLLVRIPGPRDAAAERVLAKTITSGTSDHSSTEIAELIHRLGASLHASAGTDHFQLSGSVLATNLGAFLGIVAEVLTGPTFPADEVSIERDRTVQEIHISRSEPQTIAAEALRRRLFGRHHYGTLLPEPHAVSTVSPATLARVHRTSLGPRNAFLVLVGDVQPAAAIDLAGDLLSAWRSRVAKTAPVPAPHPPKSGPVRLLDRPGAVQTNIRMAASVPPPAAPESYAVDLANTIFGGYFISRLTENLRERHGYTYTPYSRLVHQIDASYVEIASDVGAEVTAPALVETLYELGRMVASEVEPDELISAKRFRSGIQALRIQSQAGLASTLAGLVVHGLDVEYLRTYPREIERVTAAGVRDASVRHFAPSRLVTVLVGDAGRVTRDVEALGPVVVSPS